MGSNVWMYKMYGQAEQNGWMGRTKCMNGQNKMYEWAEQNVWMGKTKCMNGENKIYARELIGEEKTG